MALQIQYRHGEAQEAVLQCPGPPTHPAYGPTGSSKRVRDTAAAYLYKWAKQQNGDALLITINERGAADTWVSRGCVEDFLEAFANMAENLKSRSYICRRVVRAQH